MHIFIDESGTFTGVGKRGALSVVGALIIPDAQLAKLEKKYSAMRSTLPQQDGEVKGRLLSEPEVDAVVSLPARFQALFEITAIDMGINTAGAIDAHKNLQAERLTKHLTDRHHPNVRAGLLALRDRLDHMTHQLYVQSVITFDVIGTVLEHATLYYSQRIPKELARFNWVIDGKARGHRTDWEDWWFYIVRPMLQSASLRKPMAMLEVGDYSHFERFNTAIPAHLKPHFVPGPRDTGAGDLNMLMTESFRFSSDAEPGLEMVDILTNATRRALTGSLGIRGWRGIPGLMIHPRQHYIHIVTLMNSPPPRGPYHYMPVLRYFSRGGRNMLAPRFLRP